MRRFSGLSSVCQLLAGLSATGTLTDNLNLSASIQFLPLSLRNGKGRRLP